MHHVLPKWIRDKSPLRLQPIRKIAALLFGIVFVAQSHGASVFKVGRDLGLDTQSGMSFNSNTALFSAGSAYHRFEAVEVTNSLHSVNLPTGSVFPAGIYKVWIRGLGTFGNGALGNIIVDLGGGSNTLVIPGTKTWTNMLVTAPSSFTNALLTMVKKCDTSQVMDYNINAVYVSGNTNSAIVDSGTLVNSDTMALDFSHPTVTNDVDIVKGNLLYNSAFHSGMAGGWIAARTLTMGYPVTGDTNSLRKSFQSDGIDTSVTLSNHPSVKIGPLGANFSLSSPAIRMRGTNVWRKYTFSLWAKSSGVSQLTRQIAHTVPEISGFTAPAGSTNTFSTTLTTNWQRLSSEVYLNMAPSREIFVLLSHIGEETAAVWVTMLQLEEGSLTDWQAHSPMEVLLKGSRGKAGNIWAPNESATASIITYNGGASSSNISVNYEVFNAMNTKVTNGAVSITATVGAATNSLPLPSGQPGAYRAVIWYDGSPSHYRPESTYAVVDMLGAPTGTNSLWGVHFNGYPDVFATNSLFGFSWWRGYSSGSGWLWNRNELTEGNIDWSQGDFVRNQYANSGSGIILAPVLSSSEWKSWVVRTNGVPNMLSWTNYVMKVVDRYKDHIITWEDFNEPHGSSTGFDSTELGQWASQTERAIHAANPAARYIAGGGVATTADWLTNTWANMDASSRSNTYAFSVHLYPGNEDYMDATATVPAWVTTILPWAATNRTYYGTRIINSESGVWSLGQTKGERWGYILDGEYGAPDRAVEVFRRGGWQTSERLIQTALRSVGWDWIYMVYDARFQGYDFKTADTQSTLWEFDDGIKPEFVAMLHAVKLLNAPIVVGSVVHSGASDIEAFLWKSGDLSVIACWNQTRNMERTMTTSGSIAFEVRDMWGKQIQTNSGAFKITRQPRYLVSGLATNVLADLFTGATISTNADTTAPEVSIDVSPFGTVTSKHLPLHFKWTSVDSRWVNTDQKPSYVLTRWKVDGVTAYSDWGNTPFVAISTLPSAGTYTLTVQAKDNASNTNTVTGPSFSVGGAIEDPEEDPEPGGVIVGAALRGGVIVR